LRAGAAVAFPPRVTTLALAAALSHQLPPPGIPEPGAADAPDAGAAALELLAQGRLDEGSAAAERGWALAGCGASGAVHRLAVARGLLALARGEHARAFAVAEEGEARCGPSSELHLVRGWALEAMATADGVALRDRSAWLAAAAGSFGAALDGGAAPDRAQVMPAAAGWLAWTRLGAVQLLQGRAAQALASFERALAERPDHLEALLGHAEARLAAGDPKGALAELEPLLPFAPDAWAIAAFAAGALGSASEAALFLARALASPEPWVSAAWRERAQALRAGAAAREG
jgi:tetratricopeptide (TPR) repeat protein